MAFGVLGKTGRGSWEHAGVAVEEIEILCAGLDATVGSTGGFCVGSTAVVDHQRLSGAGYCFSASAPPYTSTASIHAIATIEKKGPELIRVLQGKARHVRMALAGTPGIEVKGDDISPLIHIRLARSAGSNDADEDILQRVSESLMEQQIVVQVSQYVPGDIRKPAPSLKVLVSAAHTDADLDNAVAQIKRAFGRVLA
jgi:serine palmitoyltransferase